jgi:hypothetical protein
MWSDSFIFYYKRDMDYSDDLNLWRRQKQRNNTDILEILGKHLCSDIAGSDFNGPYITSALWRLQGRSEFRDKCIHVLQFYSDRPSILNVSLS